MRHHRRAALLDCPEALLGRELLLQDMRPGYWILPQPAQARLQRNSGSSMSTSGYRFPARELLAKDVGRHGPHFGSGYTHRNWDDLGKLLDPIGPFQSIDIVSLY